MGGFSFVTLLQSPFGYKAVGRLPERSREALQQLCPSECWLLNGYARSGLLPPPPACVFPGGLVASLGEKQIKGWVDSWADLAGHCWADFDFP